MTHCVSRGAVCDYGFNQTKTHPPVPELKNTKSGLKSYNVPKPYVKTGRMYEPVDTYRVCKNCGHVITLRTDYRIMQ